MRILKLNKKEAQTFLKYFCKNNEFSFEGCWFRTQRPGNQSGYIDETTVRRRYIHFYNTYNLENENSKNYLSLKKHYLYVSNTLPECEIKEYQNKILNALKVNSYDYIDGFYTKGEIQVKIINYDIHPQNTTIFPENYKSCDIVVCSPNYDYKKIQDRMWELSRNIYRPKEKREDPIYIKSAKELLKYLPAQIEMGCGPSIEAKIPPLYDLLETYKVQNQTTSKLYFAEQDTLILDLINNPEKMFKEFTRMPYICISAKHTLAYKTFSKLYKDGYFKGVVFNNNFDRLVERLDIPGSDLRAYESSNYFPQAVFDKDVKSLICLGCHADRRQIQKQAREHGLKVIYIDPEGFYNKGFVQHLIASPKANDIIFKTTFKNAMKELNKEIKKDRKTFIKIEK